LRSATGALIAKGALSVAIDTEDIRPTSSRGLCVLVVFCHPRQDSFSAAVRDRSVAALQQAGHVVELLDLYGSAFSPALQAEEHRRYHDPAANRLGIEDHIALLQGADALLLIYPTWWYGVPAMLKGWFDRIWVPGVAFRLTPGAIQPLLTNIRRIGVVTTYGSPRWLLWFIGWPDRRMIERGLRRLCARRCRMDWLGLTSFDRRTPIKRQEFLMKVQTRFGGWR
jgi:NAD(P)H dehydrogenase (quinone)